MNSPSFSKLVLLLLLPVALPASLVHDRQMEKAARVSYIYRTVLQDRVAVSAEFGILTLTGSVESQAERMLAEDTARLLPWVEEVRNKVTIQPSHPAASDPSLRLQVLARLRLRTGVSIDAIRVSVAGGVATLSGTARDETQKSRTGLITAQVAGIKEVRNELLVAPNSRDLAPVEVIDDASVTAQVIAALREYDPALAARARISTTDGNVRLTGTASSEAEKAHVTKIVSEVHGVRFVANVMKSSP